MKSSLWPEGIQIETVIEGDLELDHSLDCECIDGCMDVDRCGAHLQHWLQCYGEHCGRY